MNTYRIAKVLVFLLLVIPLVCQAKVGLKARLVWNANTEPDLAGYKIYYVEEVKGWTDPSVRSYDVGNVTSFYVRDLPGIVEGVPMMFAVTAYDDVGNESEFGPDRPVDTLDFTPPQPPGGCELTQE